MYIHGVRGIHAIPLDKISVLIHFFDIPRLVDIGEYERPNWDRVHPDDALIKPGTKPIPVKTSRKVHRVEFVQKMDNGTAKVVEIPAHEFAQVVKQFGCLDNVPGTPVDENEISWDW